MPDVDAGTPTQRACPLPTSIADTGGRGSMCLQTIGD
jgi:hypothetical protein